MTIDTEGKRMNDHIKVLTLAIIGTIIAVSVLFFAINYEQINLSIHGDIKDNKVKPIVEIGRLFEPVLYDKLWVKSYTIGYANSTNRFYVKYTFIYDIFPHKAQQTKWQECPFPLIIQNWETITAFAGSWLPDEAYNWTIYSLEEL